MRQLRRFSKQGGCRDWAGDQSVATARGWGTQSLLGTRWLCLPVAGVPDKTHSLPEMLPEEEKGGVRRRNTLSLLSPHR